MFTILFVIFYNDISVSKLFWLYILVSLSPLLSIILYLLLPIGVNLLFISFGKVTPSFIIRLTEPSYASWASINKGLVILKFNKLVSKFII